MNDYADFSRAFHRVFTRDPNRCVNLGVEENLANLPDPSESARRTRLAEMKELLNQLTLVQPHTSNGDERLDLELAQLHLLAAVHRDTYEWAGEHAARHTPSAGQDIGAGVFLLLTNDPRPAGERLADITSRLEQVPDYLVALLDRLVHPVERWVSMDKDKVAGLPSLFRSIAAFAEDQAFADGPRLTRAITRAESALESYVGELERLPTIREFHVGVTTAKNIVKLRGIDLDFDQLRSIASDYLARTGEQIEQLRGTLCHKYQLDPDTPVAELEAFLNQRFAVAAPGDDLDIVLERYRQELALVTSFVEQSGLFPLFDQQEIRILKTPHFMLPSIPAGAMLPPAPFRSGPPTSQIYLTLSDELLNEHTQLSIPTMIIHEAMPGHHLQLATAARHPSIIRKHFEAMDQAEGWTTMLEDYMLDKGYMPELADEARFIGKRDISRIGARVGIDLFFMTGDKSYLELGVPCDLSSDDPFVAANELLCTVTGFSPARAQAELNWYSQERGYPLSYLTGNHLVWQLKADVARSQHGKLTGDALDRRFHEVYLAAGNMPLSLLRRVFTASGLL